MNMQRNSTTTGVDQMLLPPPLMRKQAVEPNRLNEAMSLYINVDNYDPMDSLAVFRDKVPNIETNKVHQAFENTPQNREQMLIAVCIQLTQRVNELERKISGIKRPEDVPTTMSAKRKLSPTPAPVEQPPEKKPKPSTPQKEEQPTSNEQVSDVKVLDASLPFPSTPPRRGMDMNSKRPSQKALHRAARRAEIQKRRAAISNMPTWWQRSYEAIPKWQRDLEAFTFSKWINE